MIRVKWIIRGRIGLLPQFLRLLIFELQKAVLRRQLVQIPSLREERRARLLEVRVLSGVDFALAAVARQLRGDARLGDFGLSLALSKSDGQATTQVGTPHARAGGGNAVRWSSRCRRPSAG